MSILTLDNYYYSGQGSLLTATRNALTGKPEGFIRIGNIPDLTLDIEVQKFEHKESESGSRLQDLSIIKEKKGKFSATLESLNLANLALGFYGADSSVTGATVASETVKAFLDKRCPLAHPDVSAVTVNAPATTLFTVTTAYLLNALVRPITPNGHYYKVTTAGTTAGTEPTWPTSGGTVTSGTVVFTDMGTMVKVLNVDYELEAKYGHIIPLTTGSITEGEELDVAYTYAGYGNLEAFTTASSPERWLRFMGLNTIDDTGVIIDLYRAQFDPLTGYGLINEELGSLKLTGSLLADPFITVGSKFFRQWKIDA